MPTPRTPRPPKLYRFDPISRTPALRAADIVTAALKFTGLESLQDLVTALGEPESVTASKLATIQFTVEQLDLIDRCSGHLQLLRNKPTVSLSECPVCEQVWASTARQLKCTLTRDCPGVPEKSGSAKKNPL